MERRSWLIGAFSGWSNPTDNRPHMRRSRRLLLALSGLLVVPLLGYAAQAQTSTASDAASTDFASLRDCRPPAGAKEAQVLAFDKTSLEAKLAVSIDKGEFKVVSVKVWNRPQDARPIVPVIEAARITQGKLHFFTPNLNADPEPVHDKQFLLSAAFGGTQVCWATESSLLKEVTASRTVIAPAASAPDSRRPTR